MGNTPNKKEFNYRDKSIQDLSVLSANEQNSQPFIRTHKGIKTFNPR